MEKRDTSGHDSDSDDATADEDRTISRGKSGFLEARGFRAVVSCGRFARA